MSIKPRDFPPDSFGVVKYELARERIPAELQIIQNIIFFRTCKVTIIAEHFNISKIILFSSDLAF